MSEVLKSEHATRAGEVVHCPVRGRYLEAHACVHCHRAAGLVRDSSGTLLCAMRAAPVLAEETARTWPFWR